MEVESQISKERKEFAINSDTTTGTIPEKQKTADYSDTIVPLDKILEQHGSLAELRTIANSGLQDSTSKKYIIDISTLFASVYDNVKNAFKDEECNKLSELSRKFKDNPEIMKNFSNWFKSRKEMIRTAKLAAEELDQPLFIINIARIIGSVVEILNSLNLCIYEKFCFTIAFYASTISPKLGFITERALELAPHLRFMGFASSFVELLRSQMVISRVVNAMKNDKNTFTPLKKWFDETKELDDSVKKLFPYGINNEITTSIEKALKDLGEEEKIFSATVLSNLMGDPMIHKNGKFMAEVILFCRSDIAKLWYKRLMMGGCPSDLECNMLDLRTELQQLEGAFVDTASKLEMGKCTVDQLENTAKHTIRSNLGRLVICGMSGMSIYCCYGNLRSGSKHRYSDTLRELSTNAQIFLNAVEKIRF